MKSTTAIVILFLLIQNTSISQNAIDFTITDTHGNTHSLYSDYLNNGTTVLIDFFFVDCPPCNAFAPSLQGIYEEWGSGQADVQFLSLSSKSFDSNADVSGYEATHGITSPGAGEDGGAYDVYQDYVDGGFGPIWGSPFFIVVAPDGSMQWNVSGSGTAGRIAAINAALSATGATGGNITEPEPTRIDLQFKDTKDNAMSNVIVSLTSTEANAPSYPIILDDNYGFEFLNFNEEYPDLQDPILTFSTDGDWLNGVFTTDILFIQRHLLLLQPFEQDYQFKAADVSQDGQITAFDMSIIRKTILQKIDAFPSGISWVFEPESIAIDTSNNTQQAYDILGIKLGDLNRH